MQSLSKLITNLITRVKNLYHTEPVVVLTAVASAVVFVAANFGIVVNETSLLSAFEYIVPLLLTGGVIRSQVTPA
jgi:hypothetical protein